MAQSILQPPTGIVDTRNLFQQAEVRAEALIGYLRMGIAITLAVAFALSNGLSPAPPDPMVWFQQLYAVGTMVAYFAFGLLAVGLIRWDRFSPWMKWPSAAGDCMFILVGLWFSMQNTGLAGQFIVVLPTLWLAPVVLACGVLRFNPGVQAFIIVLLVTGLIWLDRSIAHPTDTSPVEILDFFYAEAPNIMRLVMLALAGTVLVVATYRTRALFLRTLQETERRVNLTRYVPAEVAPQLSHAGMAALTSGSRQDMAVMFVDMRGFTARAEHLTPEALSLFVTEYRARITAVARRHGGIVDKFMGDAAMIVFRPEGAPQDAARRAVTCAEDLVEEVAGTWHGPDDPIAIGIGAHWGEVFVGVVGDEERLEFSVFGDTVNIAARLEELTKVNPSSIILSKDLLERASIPMTGWQELPASEVRGRSGALSIYGKTP